MYKDHESTARVELGTIVLIQQDQSPTAKRNNQRCIRKGLPKNNCVRGGPNLLVGIVGCSDVRNKNRSLNRPALKEKRGSGVHHGVRGHGGDAAEVILGLILLRRIWADECALDATGMASFHQSTPRVFDDIIADQDQRSKVPATELPKRPANLCPRS
jgi:hypothetical protein